MRSLRRSVAESRSHCDCRPIQNWGVVPKYWARRRAVSALTARLPSTISSMRRAGTRLSSAKRFRLSFKGFRNSSNSTSPGCTGFSFRRGIASSSQTWIERLIVAVTAGRNQTRARGGAYQRSDPVEPHTRLSFRPEGEISSRVRFLPPVEMTGVGMTGVSPSRVDVFFVVVRMRIGITRAKGCAWRGSAYGRLRGRRRTVRRRGSSGVCGRGAWRCR